MKIQVEIKQSLSGWKERFRGHLHDLYLFTAATMQTNRGMLFMKSGSYNGHERWAPLKLRKGQPLKDRGTLSKSIGPIQRPRTGLRPQYNDGTVVKIGRDMVTIGTSLAYAPLMNKGGTIKPKKSKLLWIPLRQNMPTNKGAPVVKLGGKYFLLAKQAVIPPRRFDEYNQQDKDELHTSLTNEVARCLQE